MAALSSRRLEELTLPQVREMIGPSSILMLPIGSVEQHGPHLPLTTDHLIAAEAAKAVVLRGGEELDLWLLPTLAVSKANEHAWASGTLWLQATTLLSVVNDIASSAATTGARRLVFPQLPRWKHRPVGGGLPRGATLPGFGDLFAPSLPSS